jgi:signal transduction histidine kinase/CheY-like chemotaxis protein
LYRRLDTVALVVELFLAGDAVVRSEPAWLPVLTLIPGLCIIGLSLAAHRLLRRGMRVEAAAGVANDERMRLLANMSHELRTPLTGILGQAELMTDEGGMNERQTTRLARLTEAGVFMRDIVDRVIDVARPDEAFDTPVLTACDLDPLVRACLDIIEGEARRKGVLLTRVIDPAVPRRMMLDGGLVKQVVINLLMNAVKFTSHGTVALRVTGDQTRLRFEVADTGPGIPAGKRHRLFRAYDRLDAQGGKGTGLGLSITEHFVRRMGGEVGFADNPGGGSLFWIELPIVVPAAPVAAPAATPPAPPEPGQLRILLADDLDLTRTVTADFLRSAGHLVTEVANGEAAVAAVREHDFDVLLTDMRMPVVDGLEVTRRVRALPGHRGRTPVVLVTADLIAIEAGESSQTGVDVCVRKPFTRSELLAAVATASRLIPAPDQQPGGDPVLDLGALAELRRSLGDRAFAGHLDAAVQRIGDLIALLERPNAGENHALGDAAHDLTGVAGLLGLTALSPSLRWFDTARDRMEPAAALHEAAVAAREALRRHVLIHDATPTS